MPRPKTVPDSEVMAAAMMTLAERGMAEFTLSDIARKVGLSRATLIQRFGDRSAILRRLAEHEVQATRDYLARLPFETGVTGLWRFIDEIVRSMGTGEGFSVRVALAAIEAREPDLKRLADQRYRLVQKAMADRLPDRVDRVEVSRHLHSVIAGATMQWVAAEHDNLALFVLEQVAWSYRRLFPEFSIELGTIPL